MGLTWLDAALAYVAAINVVTFTAFALDKRLAIEGRRRVPEATLLQLAIVGGSVGAVLAQQLLRHKTRKQPFRSWLIAILAGQVAFAAAMMLPPVRHAVFATVSGLSVR